MKINSFRNFVNYTKGNLIYEQQQPTTLMPGNYMRALLGAKKIEQLIEFCQNEVKRREQIDRTTTDFYIGLSIGYFLQNNFDKAGKALIDGSKAKYQDIARKEKAKRY